MLYNKIQPQSFLGSVVEDFKSVLSYMGMAAILFNGAEVLEQIVNTHNQFQGRGHLKITQFYTCTCIYPRGKGRTPSPTPSYTHTPPILLSPPTFKLEMFRIKKEMQLNFNGSNIFGTMAICSRHG